MHGNLRCSLQRLEGCPVASPPPMFKSVWLSVFIHQQIRSRGLGWAAAGLALLPYPSWRSRRNRRRTSKISGFTRRRVCSNGGGRAIYTRMAPHPFAQRRERGSLEAVNPDSPVVIMAASSCPCIPFFFLFLFSVCVTTTTLAQVPASQTLRFVNEGEFGDYATEYGDSYRTTPLFAAPYQLMWHNATPGQFYIGLRLGLQRQEPLFRWVWDANRGRPVGEKATLTFGTDGNLVLAEADGRAVWSTGTANKGVVGLRLLPAGNLVLYDRHGRFVWQSFDHPTDTLFVGQSLRLTGPTKLVSRKSEAENSEGKYSLVLEPQALTLYMDAPPKPLPYGRLTFGSSSETAVTLTATPEGNGATSWQLGLKLSTGGSRVLAQPKYNATITLLRLQVDGNLVAYTYNEQVDSQPTERTFTFFSDGSTGILRGCELPSKCGSLGVCRDEGCVACPTPRGLLGWSESCSAPKPGACRVGGANTAGYYKVAGVESFITKFVGGEGTVRLEDCRRKCSMDCNCLGFFYWEESSRCWLAPTLGTLNRVPSSSHVAYIKSN